MPKINPDPNDENVPKLATHAQGIVPSGAVVITGVGRKVNTGNYENIDLYAGVTIPLSVLPDDLDKFKEAVAAACELGFLLASQETGSRYNLIKEMQAGGRKEDPTPT